MTIDLSTISRELKKPVEQIESAVKLLDEGNTIPFITRFRKDQTGGFNEEQLLIVKQSITRLRAIADRKAFILKSIDSQGKLTDELKAKVEAANSSRELEDVYLPYKPKKQSLATIARENGLEPLANDIYEGREPDKDLASRAIDFVRVDKNLNSVDDVIAGVGHILAEKFSDNIELRNELRSIIHEKGRLTTRLIEIEDPEEKPDSDPSRGEPDSQQQEKNDSNNGKSHAGSAPAQSTASDATVSVEQQRPENPDPDTPADPESDTETSEASDQIPDVPDEQDKRPADDLEVKDSRTECPPVTGESDNGSVESKVENETVKSQPTAAKKKRKKKKKKEDDPYKEFVAFSHPLAKMPYHKTLAVNRGEKNGRLKVKIEFDEAEFLKRANQVLVPDDHSFAEFLRSCVKDSLTRLVIPSLEREIRREITEAAEKHAVRVFARNLKNLLLQSPIRDHTVLAIDPGYKRGCSVAVIDSGGQMLEHGHIFVVGNEQRRKQSIEKLIELINRHNIPLIAIGNGAACREAEQLVSDMIESNFKERELRYAIVNEAGASVYSTSEVGREELPDLSPAVRSAVSIGRRLIDPLSELVKISPANIGVGLYQHDVKAKHLSETLDDVVQFCVNRVGVDVNTASPSLLKYISGMNQLTARRVYEFRQTNGPFRNREQLKEVAGFGDATFVQAAGFLRVHGGDQPLDSTAIHPESYPTAMKIFERVGCRVDEVFPIAARQTNTQSANADALTAQTAASESTSPQARDSSGEAMPESVVKEAEANSEAVAAGRGDVEIPSGETPASVMNVTVENTVPGAVPSGMQELRAEQVARRRELVKTIRELDPKSLAGAIESGQFLLRDILNSICKPEFDPRNKINQPVFRSGIIKIDDVKKDMCLDAQVVNVVDFGVFVDIGLGTSCLVHVSQLANHFIRDPHRFFAVGDVLKVWVTDVDTGKRRVALTAVQPDSLRPRRLEKESFKKRDFKKTAHRKPSRRRSEKGPGKPRRRSPKPVKPITDEMLKGSEPMRSFSDLAQFFNKQSEPGNKKEEN